MQEVSKLVGISEDRSESGHIDTDLSSFPVATGAPSRKQGKTGGNLSVRPNV